MMSSHSTPNLQQSGTRNNNNNNNNTNTLTVDDSITNSTQQSASSSIYTILQNQSGLNFAPISSSFQLHQQIVTLSSSSSVSSTSTLITTQQQHCHNSHNSDELRTAGGLASCDSPPPPVPPVRDASSLKNIKYGPGHEKYPSWPVAAAAEQPQILRGPPSGGSHRSKSWTDHTNYPKEKVMTYTRPFMKRPNSQQKLKTVMERCEKISSESHRGNIVEMDVTYLPRVDREGKALGDLDYMVPSPPERDLNHKTQALSQNELDEYTRPPYQSDQHPSKQQQQQQQLQQPQPQSQPATYQQLTQADLEEYTRSYEEALINSHHQHQKQPSYAQSEGYHSYVSSTDSMSTPFLDRLRRDSEAVVTTNRASTASTVISTSSHSNSWDEPPERERDITGRLVLHREGGRDSVVTTSSGSASSSETLKWHGSMSDLSVASSSCTHNNNNNNNSNNSSSSKQLIAHSARVKTPQRHNSESVLYIGPPGEQQQQQQPNKLLYEHSVTTSTGWKEREIRNNHQNKLKLFAVNTYTVQPDEQTQQCNNTNSSNSSSASHQQSHHRIGGPQSPNQTSLSVADRVSELERQQITRYTYLDPDKKHRVSDPTLKAIQKKALLSFYERHHHNAVTNSNKQSGSPTMSWRSEPQLTQSPVQPKPQSPPPQPPPRPKAHPASRRASSASDYAKGTWRENVKKRNEEMKEPPSSPRHQHSNSCGSLSDDLLGPVIMGPSISVDDWVPERPPKNPHLRTAFPDLFQEPRTPSPDLPPPSPPTVLETEVINNDEPFPPPPSELEVESWSQKSLDMSMNNHDDHTSTILHKKTEHVIEEKHLIDNNFRQHIRNSTVLEEKHYQHETRQRYSPPRSLNIPNLAEPQIRHSITGRNIDIRTSQRQHNRSNSIYPPAQHQKSPHSPDKQLTKRSPFVRSTSYEKDSTVGFAAHRQIPTERTSMRHNPSTQKLVINGRISVAVSQKVHNNAAVSGQFRAEPLRPHHMLRTAPANATTSQQIPAPQVPITNCLMPFSAACTSDSADSRDFRPRTQSVIENGHHAIAPPLKPRQSKTYQSMRQSSTRQQQTIQQIHHDDFRYTSNILTNHHGVMLPKQPIKYEDGLCDGKQSSTTSLSLSQSKASYLSYRRDRERGQPDADYGSYKRIISPSNGNNNHNLSLECTTMDCDRVSGTSDEKWSTTNIHRHSLTTKDSTESKESLTTAITHNNNNLLHRLSSSNSSDKKELKLKQSDSPPPPALPQSRPCNLPDVLPVSAKISPPRSLPSPETSPKLQYYNNTNSSSRLSSKSAVIQQTSSPHPQSPTKESHPILSPVSLIFPLDKRSSVSSTTSSLVSSNAISKSESSSPKSSLISLSHSSDIKEDLPKKCSSVSVTTTSPSSSSSPIKKQPSVTEQLVVITSTSSTSSTSTSTAVSTSTSTSTAVSTSTTSSTSTPTSSHTSTSTSSSTPTHTLVETTSKCDSSTPQVIEGLQLIQRTEVVLRVNASTTDAASQTDQQRDTDDDTSPIIRTPLPTRRKLQEEIECEQLSRDLANQLSPSDKLKGILVPAPEHKKSTDYVSGLFKFEVTSRPRPNYATYRNSLISISSSTSTTSTTDASSISSLQKSISSSYSSEPSSPLSPISTYFTTSESKAKFLTRYSRDMTQYNEVQTTKDLNQKKEELMNRLDRKLEVLRSEQLVVNEESRINDTLGEQVSNYVSRLARPQEVAKYRLHVEEVGKITSLLLGLSGRLARAENALMGLSSDHAERKILEMKRDKLQEQLEEAKKLKENIDRRSINVSNILYKYLNSEEYGDYDHFINMKAKLIMDAREIADKIKLGEEQLTALRETLNIVKSD